MTHPRIFLQSGRDKRLLHGHPWIFSNEIRMDSDAKALAPGSLVTVCRTDGKPLATGFFNPHTLIAIRVLSRDPDTAIDAPFWATRLKRALALRERLFTSPHYRLIHAESDGFPGMIADRFGDVLSVQMNTAGMAEQWPLVRASLLGIIKPQALVVRNDARSRLLEGLAIEPARIEHGALDGPVEILEGAVKLIADPLAGQKTGWFYDQRDNRAFIASLAKDETVLDVFCYAGSFGLHAAAAGAAHVTFLDRSEAALATAVRAAALNGAEGHVSALCGDAFAEMESLAGQSERFGIVIADPPAFIKSRKDMAQGLKGYRKVARHAAALVKPGGILLLASCSHHASLEDFMAECVRGIGTTGRGGRILRVSGAAPDHPLHPMLPESAYLKALTFQLD